MFEKTGREIQKRLYTRSSNVITFYTYTYFSNLYVCAGFLKVVKLDGVGPVDNKPSTQASPLCQKKFKN